MHTCLQYAQELFPHFSLLVISIEQGICMVQKVYVMGGAAPSVTSTYGVPSDKEILSDLV